MAVQGESFHDWERVTLVRARILREIEDEQTGPAEVEEMAVQKRIHKPWSILLVAVCLATVLAALGVGSAAFGKGAGKSPPPSAYGVQLDPNNLPGVYDQLPAENRALIDRENVVRNTAAAEHPLSKRTPGQGENEHPTPHPAIIAAPHRDAGAGTIIEDGCAYYLHSYDLDGNQWFERRSDRTLTVCTGTAGRGSDQGLVYVNATEPDDSGPSPAQLQPQPHVYLTPTRHGAVDVVDASGEVLKLRAQDGTLFYFDVSRLAYVDGPPAEGTRTAKASP